MAEEFSILATESMFEDFILSKSEKTSGLKVLHFKSEWSEPCKQMTSLLLDIKADEVSYPGVEFAEVEAEGLPEVSMKYNITAVPTVLFFCGGKEVERVDGLRKAKITTFIKSFILNPKNVITTAAPRTVEKPKVEKEPLDERLKKLINKHDIMIFMKGSPTTPRCGFSRTLMSIFNETGLPFETFDILEDEEVRQGLKTFSSWQTYPQVYVKGELIGGLDIIKDLKESDELIPALKGQN